MLPPENKWMHCSRGTIQCTGYKVQVQDEWKRKYHRALERCGENSSKSAEAMRSEKVPCVVDF